MIAILTKITLVGFLFLCFSFQGIYEEKVYGSEYTSLANGLETKFRYREPNINLFLISLLSIIISGAMIFSQKMNKKLFSFKDKFILGFLYTLGKYSSENSYNYIDYISKQISKSLKCLIIVVIDFLSGLPILGSLIEKAMGQKLKTNKVTKMDILKGFLCTLSIFLFSYQPEMHKHSVYSSMYLGYCLIAVSLIADGLLGLKEKLIKEEVKSNPELKEYQNMTSWYFMFSLNLAVVIYMAPIFAYHFYINDDFSNNVHMYVKSTNLMSDLSILLGSAILAQTIVFQILQRYGPLSLAIYTGTRKILNIFLSIIWFEKTVSTLQKLSLVFGISVMLLELFEKSFDFKPKKEEQKKKIN